MTTTTMAPGAPRFQRLASIDVLRGLTIAFMILVNNNGNNDLAYRALNHSPWNGCTPTDLVFPTFLFIMGISLVLSYMARTGRGEKRTTLLGHIVRRFVLLFFFGLVVNGFPYFHLATLRIYGVLQRIAVCYLLASLLLLVTRRIWVMIGLTVALLAGYWVLLRWVPVPGHGMPVRNFPFMDHDINLVAWLDRHIFPHRLYEGTRDPEGLLSDLPAFASTLLGMLTAFWMRSARSQQAKTIGMAVAALLLLISGSVWGLDFPINKKLWTSSYVLFAAGWSMLLLAFSYFIIEIRNWRGSWTKPFLVFGMNAITAYVFSELLSSVVSVFHVNPHQSFQEWSYELIFKRIINPAFGSLVYSLVFVLVCFIPVWILYRRKIFLKL